MRSSRAQASLRPSTSTIRHDSTPSTPKDASPSPRSAHSLDTIESGYTPASKTAPTHNGAGDSSAPPRSPRQTVPSSLLTSTLRTPDDWPSRLRHTLRQLQQTRSGQELRSLVDAQTFAPTSSPATAQDLKREGQTLLRQLQTMPLPPALLHALQRDLDALAPLPPATHAASPNAASTSGDASPPNARTLLSLQHNLQRVLRPLLQTTAHLATREPASSPETQAVTSTEEADSVKKKEKSLWEKIADFFKKVFQFLCKLLDFLSPLLNFIPGIGPALFAAYHGVKLIVSLVKGDGMGALQSLTSMVSGIAGPIGGVAGTVLRIGAKATQTGQAIAQAVESKNPLGVLGALGSVAGGLGGIGKSLGKLGGEAARIGQELTQAMTYTQQGLQATTAGATAIDGAARGDLDRALAGLGAMVNTSSQWVGGSAARVMQHTTQGIQVLQNLARGRYANALQGFAHSLQPLAALPEARPVLQHIQTGLRFASDLSQGRIAHALARLPHVANVATAASSPAHTALSWLSTLANPGTRTRLRDVQQQSLALQHQPALQGAMDWAQQAGAALAHLPTQPKEAMEQWLQHPLWTSWEQGLRSGQLEQGVQAFQRQLQEFVQHPSVSWLTGWTMQAHQSLQALPQTNTPPSPTPLANAATFLQSALSPQLGVALGQLLQAAPQLQNKADTRRFVSHTAALQQWLQPLASGQIPETWNQMLSAFQRASSQPISFA